MRYTRDLMYQSIWVYYSPLFLQMSRLRLELPTCAVLYSSNPHLFLSCTAACKKSAVIARGCQLRLFNYLMHQLIHLPTSIFSSWKKQYSLGCPPLHHAAVLQPLSLFTSVITSSSSAASQFQPSVANSHGAWAPKSSLSRLNYHMSQFSSRFNSRWSIYICGFVSRQEVAAVWNSVEATFKSLSELRGTPV